MPIAYLYYKNVRDQSIKYIGILKAILRIVSSIFFFYCGHPQSYGVTSEK